MIISDNIHSDVDGVVFISETVNGEIPSSSRLHEPGRMHTWVQIPNIPASTKYRICVGSRLAQHCTQHRVNAYDDMENETVRNKLERYEIRFHDSYSSFAHLITIFFV